MYENIIAIPFRNRDNHLKYFIKNTVPLLQQHLPNSKVVVVEQNEGKLFNRGALINVAFKEYENKTKYFFAHDIDIIPSIEVIKSIYTKKDIEMFRVKSAHSTSLGGIVKVKHDIIFNINGFPNNIWGWGIEDRALYYRCCMKNINITENSNQSFKVMPHTSNIVQYSGEKKKISDMWMPNYIDKLDDKQKEEMIMSSGLNNLKYTILERKNIHDMVEIIKVDI
jgi:beta-1,4-galactosyltransferase 1